MPDWLEEVRRRLAAADLDGATERNIAEELAQHLEDRYAELLARGASPTDARARVLAELGDDDALARLLRSTHTPRPAPLPLGRPSPGGWLAGLWTDAWQAMRTLGRAPAYSAFAVAVIALGIGVTTLIFAAADSLLLRPPAGVAEPERLVAVYTSDYSGPRFGGSSWPDVAALREVGGVFDGVAAYALQTFGMVGDDWSDRGMGETVSDDYFRVLGVRPAVGRFFSAEETEPGRDASVVVLGHAVWMEHFGGSADAVGSTVTVRGHPLTVIGVAPEEFGGALNGLRTEVWLPLGAPTSLIGVDPAQRGDRSFFVRARLGDGVDVRAVREAVGAVASRLHGEYPDAWTDIDDRSRVFTVLTEAEARVPPQARGAVMGIVGAATAAVLVVLLIACTNVANLMLFRSAARRAEMGVRVALGATRGTVARHLLVESVLLALAGGTGGVLLTLWLLGLARAVRVPGLHVTLQVGLDGSVLAFATVVTVATGLLFGLAPALEASGAPAPLMRDDPRATGRSRLRRALIVVQVAASIVLLTTGGLLLRSLGALRGSETGYDAEGVVVANFDLRTDGYSEEAAGDFYDALLARVRALPGTEAATLAEQVPLGMGWVRRSVVVGGYTPAAGEDMEVPNNRVAPGWFRTMGLPLLRGRDFTAADRVGAPPVVIVSEAFAERFWPGEDPLGQRVGLEGSESPFAEVVGVAADAKYRDADGAPVPYFYYPYLQHPSADMRLFARTTGAPATLVAAVRAGVRSEGPSLPPPTVHTFEEHVALARLPQRVAAMALSGLGLLAVGIALVGLYGLVALTVAQRAREFGIRIAMGALGADVRRLVMRDTLRLVAVGIACGAPLGIGAGLVMRPFLFTSPLDPVPVLGVPILLAACALLAGLGPARRASEQDPGAVLRAE